MLLAREIKRRASPPDHTLTMYCYCFPSFVVFRALAAAEGMTDVDGEGIEHLRLDSNVYSMTEIGSIGTADGSVLDGWHVNFQGEPPEAWDPYLVIVNHPVCIFYGGEKEIPSTEILEQIAAL